MLTKKEMNQLNKEIISIVNSTKKDNNMKKKYVYAVEIESNLIAYEFESEEQADKAIQGDYQNQYYLRIEDHPIADKDKWTHCYPVKWNK